jgi:excisionase family DNA binding protein
MMDDRWISVEEIAAYLGVKKDTIYKWIDRRKMPAHKVGRLWKFRKEEVDHWIHSGGAGSNNNEVNQSGQDKQ